MVNFIEGVALTKRLRHALQNSIGKTLICVFNWGQITINLQGSLKFAPFWAENEVTIPPAGSVAEWSIAPVLKTGGSKGSVSSNLTASASYNPKQLVCLGFFLLTDQSNAPKHQGTSRPLANSYNSNQVCRSI